MRHEDTLPTLALARWGEWNSTTRKEAIRIAKQRGAHSIVFYLQDLSRPVQPGRDDKHNTWKSDRAPCAWLKGPDVGKCIDCFRQTARRYNGYFQCPTCAAAIKNAGGRRNRITRQESARLRELAKRHKEAQEPVAKPAVTEVIPARKAAYDALSAGEFAAEALIQQANQELLAVGQRVYAEVKHAA